VVRQRWSIAICFSTWRTPSYLQVVGAERLIDRRGNGNYADCTLKLTFPRNPNGLYLIKGEDLMCGGD
jgi:hypothetical protein